MKYIGTITYEPNINSGPSAFLGATVFSEPEN